MNRYTWIRWIVIASAIAFIAAGCSKQESLPIDPPPIDLTASVDADEQSVDLMDPEAYTEVTLYVQDQDGYVIPMSTHIPVEEDIAKLTLQYMTQNGPGETKLPHGFTAPIPAGTEVKGIHVVKGENVAIVDFSTEFTNYEPQNERKLVEAVTWALTHFDFIDQVQIWVEGQALKEMPVQGMPLQAPLSREMGINLERASGVSLSNSMPVTLYFQSQTVANELYYVPVTRLVDRSEDKALTAVQHLIMGPLAATSLSPVFQSEVDVLDVTNQDGLIRVVFDERVLDANEQASVETMESIILSLTDSANASEVQIMVDNHAEVLGTDNHNFSHPAAKPMNINRMAM